MVEATQVHKDMEVVGNDGTHVGTVDAVEGDRIKLKRDESADGEHHYVPLTQVARVDGKIHLTGTGASALNAVPSMHKTSHSSDGNGGPLPPVANPAVVGATKRGNYYLPWVLLGLLLLALLAWFIGRDRGDAVVPAPIPQAAAPATGALPVEAVALPNGQSIDLEPEGLNYELQRFLASTEATPRTFQFDKLNFDTASAAIRPVDEANIDALARILAAYPAARVRVTGYTDARGGAQANAKLGRDRAAAVTAALAAKGIARNRIDAASGGEANATETNATGEGQFENRRTELTVLAK